MNILITGGASGLGETITRRLAANAGDSVYFTYNKSETKAASITEEFKNTGSIKCNFESDEEITALCAKLIELDIDVLVNNAYAGEYQKTHFHKIAPLDFLTEFKSNVMPVIYITQAAISVFRKKKAGKIITISTSALVNNPPIGTSHYVANKAYLEELAKCWAVENRKFNITSNIVSPSFMLTDLTSNFDERIVEQIIQEHPLKRLLSKEEVADTVSFLVNASPHINGMNFILNAGVDIK